MHYAVAKTDNTFVNLISGTEQECNSWCDNNQAVYPDTYVVEAGSFYEAHAKVIKHLNSKAADNKAAISQEEKGSTEKPKADKMPKA